MSRTALYLHETETDLEADVLAHRPVSVTVAPGAQRRRRRARTRVRSGS